MSAKKESSANLENCLQEIKKITTTVSTKLGQVKTDSEKEKVKSDGLTEVSKVVKKNTDVSNDTLVALSSFFAYNNAFIGGGSGGGESSDKDSSLTSNIDGVLSMLGLDNMAHLNDAAELLGKLKGIPSILTTMGSAASAALPYVAIIAATVAVAGLAVKLDKETRKEVDRLEQELLKANKTDTELAETEEHYDAAGTFHDVDPTVWSVLNGEVGFGEWLTSKNGETQFNNNIVNSDVKMGKIGITGDQVADFSQIYSGQVKSAMDSLTEDQLNLILNTSNSNKFSADNLKNLPKFNYDDPIKSLAEFTYFFVYMQTTNGRSDAETVQDKIRNLYQGALTDMVNQVGRDSWDISIPDGYNMTATSTGMLQSLSDGYNRMLQKHFKTGVLFWSNKDELKEYMFPTVSGSDPVELRDKCYVYATIPPGVDEKIDEVKGAYWWFNKRLTENQTGTYLKINQVMYMKLASLKDEDTSIEDFMVTSSRLRQGYLDDKHNKESKDTKSYFENTYSTYMQSVYEDSKNIGFTNFSELAKELGSLTNESGNPIYMDANGTINMAKIEKDYQDKDSVLRKDLLDSSGNKVSKRFWSKFLDSYKGSNAEKADIFLDNGLSGERLTVPDETTAKQDNKEVLTALHELSDNNSKLDTISGYSEETYNLLTQVANYMVENPPSDNQQMPEEEKAKPATSLDVEI